MMDDTKAVSSDTPAERPRERDVLDLGHRPQLDPASSHGDAVRPTVPERKPPTVAEGGTPVPGSALSEEELDRLSADIIMAIKTVYDPEIAADIYELGLIYKIDVDDDRNVDIQMTLTAPGCPVAGEMPMWVQNAVGAVEGVNDVHVDLVFDPPWDQSRMSDEARLAIGMF
jgi:FeS assembly SUF system protein